MLGVSTIETSEDGPIKRGHRASRGEASEPEEVSTVKVAGPTRVGDSSRDRLARG